MPVSPEKKEAPTEILINKLDLEKIATFLKDAGISTRLPRNFIDKRIQACLVE
ncbi:MAG: hypothetical protein U5K51_09250 [Flavobacteriaceae bacterium]|nr:hypothetical protein [Flavobacteriaceae bacterium]